MDPRDNVVTCVREVPKGETVAYRDGDDIKTIEAKDTIPYCHKIALVDIDKGDEVIKYGELIGEADTCIAAGHWVSHENIHSVPRDYDSELVEDTGEEAADFPVVKTDEGLKFWGYRRAEGRPGIRNHVLILPGCACGSESSRVVASQVRGAVNIVFNTGCSDVADNTEMSQKILTGFACNPNVYGVVIIGLGCETVGHKELKAKIQKMTSKPVVSFGIQDEGGTLKTIEKATRAARDMAAEAGLQQKELFDISELFMGIECGGSDATSGIASNPAVGELSDRLVDLGATTMMSESIEWIGGEHVVASRAATPKVHNEIIEVCREYEEHLKAAGQDCRAGQPTPGNKAGGLSTLDEKSLGCIRKGGTRPIVEVLEQAKQPTKHGSVGHRLHDRPRHAHRQRHRPGPESHRQRGDLRQDGGQHGCRPLRHHPRRKDVPGDGGGTPPHRPRHLQWQADQSGGLRLLRHRCRPCLPLCIILLLTVLRALERGLFFRVFLPPVVLSLSDVRTLLSHIYKCLICGKRRICTK